MSPPDGDEFTGIDTEIGEQQGIPPVPAWCLLPDLTNLPCGSVGHFAFVFNNNFLFSGSEGNGWTTDTLSSVSGKPLFLVPPMFDAPQYDTAAPEPGSLVLLGGGIAALVGLARKRRLAVERPFRLP